MALRGMAYSVRMAAYNADGARVTGLASTITATLWADGTAATLTGITITEIGSTGVYVVPLTAEQMTAYNLCVTAVSSTAGITFDPVYLDTEAGRIDVATSTRLATSGYTTPPTVADIQNGLAKTTDVANSLSSVMTVLTSGVLADIATVDSVVDAMAARMPTSGTVATTADIPTPPTPTAIADVVAPRVLGADLTTLSDAAVGSLKTIALLQVNSGIVGGSRLVVYETDGSEHAHFSVTTDADTGISSVRFPTD